MAKQKKSSAKRTEVQRKISIDMKKLKAGTLHSGRGKKHIVTSKKQALAIAFSQARHHKK